MRRPAIVRLQLLALGLVVLLVVFRAMSGPPDPEGLLVFTDMGPDQLQHEAFALDHPTRLAVEAMGAVDESGALAAYGWILNRGDGQVAWIMKPDAIGQDRSALVHAQDTLTFPAGTYDVYFASYGNLPESRRDHTFLHRVRYGDDRWQHDADKWMLALRSADGSVDELRRVDSDEEQTAAVSTSGGALWAAEPLRSDQKRSYLFQTDRPVVLKVGATGEIEGHPADYGWIEDAATGDRVWEMTEANTAPAGGSSLNRRFTGEIHLKPGLYRAVYETDEHHAYDDWAANPPFDPRSWGMVLTAASQQDAQAVHAFDPWAAREPLASILRVPSGTRRSVNFDVSQPLAVVVDALGEIAHGDRFDYGWLENSDGQRIWEMTVERARPAGGDDKNQEEMAFLNLTPGSYRLVYQTDDSHAYDDWNSDPPTHPDRWGVALFSVASDVDTSAVHVTGEDTTSTDDQEWSNPDAMPPPAPPGAPPPPMTAPAGDVLVNQLRVGNEANVRAAFELTEPTRLHVRATGEITSRGRFDYGWIEEQGTGNTVWEMKWANTGPAGGDDRNRSFDGIVELPAGKYVAHFQTDLSHAFPDFDNHPPDRPEDWGILIERAK